MASVLKCGDITAATLLSFQVQLIRLFALTFRRPCLRRTRWPKCHYEIYRRERWVLEWREGVCVQPGGQRTDESDRSAVLHLLTLLFFFFLKKRKKLCFILVQCNRCFNNIYTSRRLGCLSLLGSPHRLWHTISCRKYSRRVPEAGWGTSG